MYSNRNFLIFPVTELPKVDFSQVCETSAETLRISTDGTKSFIKWDQAPYDPTPYEYCKQQDQYLKEAHHDISRASS